MKLGVIIALEAEAEAVLCDARFDWEPLAPGEYASRAFPMRLALSGVGKAFASWSCARLAPCCELLLSMGTSGGLRSEKVGSLALAKEFVEHDMVVAGLGIEAGVTPFAGMEGPVISRLSPRAEALALGALTASGLDARALEGTWARSASGDRFIGDAEEAADLSRRTGASLCDMESAAIAKLCAFRAKLDFFSLRFVSDNADHRAQLSWEAQVRLSSRDFDSYLFELAKLL
jgi:adenosylhomocysteine nucleosidase